MRGARFGRRSCDHDMEMVAANLRPQPTWLMRWLVTESGTHRVQHTLGDSTGCRGADGAMLWAGFALLE
jgi:hypothetical protein